MVPYSPAFFIALLVAILHYAGVEFNWYNMFFWYDVLQHILGGFWVGYTTCYIWMRSMRGNSGHLFWIAIIAVVLIGIGWEIFEYVNKLNDTFGNIPYVIDTIKDILMDICGAVLAWGIIAKIRKRSKRRK